MKQAKGTVYIVDDNDSFRKSLVRLVQTFGYHTVAFESASGLLALDSYGQPGCILLDVQLPDIDGLELQGVLRKKGCSLPIVFMTGHGDIPMSVDVMRKGAVDFLLKPFEIEDLQEAIIKAIVQNTYEMQEKNGVRKA